MFGCSAKPSDTNVLQKINANWEWLFPGKTKLLSYERLNGSGDKSGYDVKVKLTIEFNSDSDGMWPAETRYSRNHLSELGVKWLKKQTQDGAIKKGDVFEISSTYSFKKTENGWK